MSFKTKHQKALASTHGECTSELYQYLGNLMGGRLLHGMDIASRLRLIATANAW